MVQKALNLDEHWKGGYDVELGLGDGIKSRDWVMMRLLMERLSQRHPA